MNFILRDLLQSEKINKITKSLEDTPVCTISGLVCVAKSQIVTLLKSLETKPVLFITYNELEAERLVKDLSYFNDEILYFPKREISIMDYEVGSNDIEYTRMEILNQIHYKKAKIIVTTIESIMQDMINEKDLYRNSINIKSTDRIDLEEFKKRLVDLGYERMDLIDGKGQFSVRGDIIDISKTDTEGIRIELWGDDIESIRNFNISSQRSINEIKEVTINPTTEKILARPLQLVSNDIKKIDSEEIAEDIELIENGNYRSKIDKYFNEFYEEKANLLDYCKDYLICIDELDKVEQRLNNIKENNKNLIKEMLEKSKRAPEVLSNIVEFNLKLEKYINLTEEDFIRKDQEEKHIFQFDFREINLYKGEDKTFESIIEESIKNKKRVLLLVDNKETRNKIAKRFEKAILTDNIDNLASLNPGSMIITSGNLSSGFENKDTNLVVLSSEDFFENKKIKRRKRTDDDAFKAADKIVFADLKEGDIVVHRNHGIGKFLGVQTIVNDNITKDYIKILYRNDDILYVPTENLDNVRKYIGGSDGIRLNKLGGKEWQETKNRVKGNLRTLAKDLIELYAIREKAKGYAFSPDTPWQNEFEASFPYQETDDQLRSINEVKRDMESPKPMDRLLCGDVGYGKTEVAIRAAFKAVQDSKQVAYLAPTTILANQQYQEFKERMKGYPVKVELLNRFRTAKEQREIIQNLKHGEIDIVVGTHRLLSEDVEFKDLGLLIIDEEHRFGVKAKEKIKKYKKNVDVLTMTATPIPRTLQMSIVGIRDMSAIYEPPHNRRPVQTYVLEYDRELIREAITKELERGGQVFYIYNYVDTIGKKAEEIEGLVPEAKVGYAHGKMNTDQMESIMQDFVNKKINVLVCTTILESGIDIPNANTIIVENADRFGLAQLYQIRGRVGRSDRQAYAYITYRKDKMMNEEAQERLKAIKEFTEFGSGFKIATRDLQIRGAGSLFGEVQSGHMEQVGYDMYNRLLNEVVQELKGEEIQEEEEEITIDISLSAFIPESYIDNTNQKIEIYQDIADSHDEKALENVIEEIVDRYGKMPEQVENLIKIARLKNMARETAIQKIQQRQMGVVFTLSKISDNQIEAILENYRDKVRFSAIGKPYITLRVTDDIIGDITRFIEILKEEK